MLSTHSNICFALVDCNNFYASCERIFNPKLNHKPLIILSSNDGCVIARSNEAKALGIQMSQPYFQIEKLCRKNNVNVLSSNFALYGDISNRVMKTLNHFCPDIEIYSIDEAFLRLDQLSENISDYAVKIRQTILQNIGIPVSIGLAPTKTLAKIATTIAKQNTTNGVYDLRSKRLRDLVLHAFPVKNIWGIGKQSAEKLNQFNINTVSALLEKPVPFLKKNFSIMMVRTTMELKGVSCISLEETHNKKNIVCSRSFGKPVTHLTDLLEAVSSYAANACKKARDQKTKAQAICVYLQTSRFRQSHEFYSASDQETLLFPSNDTFLITEIANKLLKKMVKPDYCYQKLGIVLLDLIEDHVQQNDLFAENTDKDNKEMMTLLDSINKKWGSQTIFLAREGIAKNWSVKSNRKSPRYTTCWNEILSVK